MLSAFISAFFSACGSTNFALVPTPSSLVSTNAIRRLLRMAASKFAVHLRLPFPIPECNYGTLTVWIGHDMAVAPTRRPDVIPPVQ